MDLLGRLVSWCLCFWRSCVCGHSVAQTPDTFTAGTKYQNHVRNRLGPDAVSVGGHCTLKGERLVPSAMRFLWQSVVHLPAWTLILLVRVYQWTLSPIVGRQCRFQPTCSNYFIGAVQKYGAVLGTLKGIRRVSRCHPWNPGGYDPP